MRTAFKEWAVVVDALGRGQQTLILRKGGIAESQGSFRVEHPAFLFFPTLFHQQRNAVVPAAQVRFDEIQPLLSSADQVRIEYWAKIAAVRRLDSLQQALGLAGLHVWTHATITDRFDWGGEEGIWALILRVYRLANPTTLPVLSEYGGCKSWIELGVEIATENSIPVLGDPEWSAQTASIEARLSQASA